MTQNTIIIKVWILCGNKIYSRNADFNGIYTNTHNATHELLLGLYPGNNSGQCSAIELHGR